MLGDLHLELCCKADEMRNLEYVTRFFADRLAVGTTVDYIKMHLVSVHKIGNASEFAGPELGHTENCSNVHNTKCTLL